MYCFSPVHPFCPPSQLFVCTALLQIKWEFPGKTLNGCLIPYEDSHADMAVGSDPFSSVV